VCINNSGNVLVSAGTGNFLYKRGALIKINKMAFASSVNDLNQVAGSCVGGACIYDNGRIRRLNIPSSVSSDATRINREGQVIGEYFPGDDGRPHGFLYDNGTVIDLGDLIPNDINSAGTIVGHKAETRPSYASAASRTT
jgi:probable HAF family extracellular repeat protein